MKALFAAPSEGRIVVALKDIARPCPKPDEILVAVRAAGVNRFDVMAIEGYRDPRLPQDAPVPLGLECAGEVVEAGDSAGLWRAGDRVMGRCWGGFAEFALMKANLAMPVPARLSWEQAATMHVLVVAYDAVVTNGGLRAGQSLLANAASSGIGVASMQIATLLGAGPVIGTTSSPQKLAPVAAERLPGVNIVDSRQFAPKVLELTGGKGVDVVADSVGGTMLTETLQCMALLGRLVSIGRMGATTAELDLDFLALRRLSLIGVTNRTRTAQEQAQIVAAFSRDILPALGDGRLQPLLDRTFPLAEASSAINRLAANAQVGKVILSL
jgi:NADPH2:quinone reductase